MSFSEPEYTNIEHEAERIELLSSLERALDLTYARIRRVAREQWETHFGHVTNHEPDVIVRINQRKRATARGSDFLRKPAPAKSKRKLRLPHFAR